MTWSSLDATSRMVHPVIMRVLSTNVSGSSTNASAAATPVVPFGSREMLDDTLLHVMGFLIVLTAAHPLGMLFPRYMKLPLITGYLIVGILTGPFLANLLTATSVELLASSVNAMALSFISFQAGQEIYLPELKPQIKGILQLLAALYITAMVLLTAVLTFGAGPFFYGSFDSACKLAIALLFGSIAVLGSPATVMAIKIELNSMGPFTNLMLGATMTAEFVVLISFSVARVVSSVYCAKLDISLVNLVFTMGIVFSNLVVGAVIGLVIIVIFLIPGGPDHGHDHDDDHDDDDDVAVLSSQRHHHNAHSYRYSHSHAHHQPAATAAPSAAHHGALATVLGSLYCKSFVWLFMGYLFYISTNAISQLTIAAYGHVWDVKFEPLLVLMVGSCLAGHHDKIRHDMHVILDASAPFVFLPFFVMTGASLKLDQVANAIPLMSLFFGLRYVAIFLACYGAGRWILKLPPQQYNNLWLTMTPQAGVALGLANEIKSLSSDPWASEFAATIVAAVVVNQIVGPVLCAMGLSRAGESGGGAAQNKKADSSVSGPGDDEFVDLESSRSGPGGYGGGGSMRARGHGPARGDAGIIASTGGGGAADGDVALNLQLSPVRRAVVIGDDDVACELALQLALYGAEVSLPMLDDATTTRWETVQRHIRTAFAGPSEKEPLATHVADFRQHISPTTRDHQGDNMDLTSARSQAAMKENPADLILFTGDAQRVLDHVKVLHTTISSTSTSRKPRLVAILDSARMIEPLRNRGVVCVQSSMALSNIGMRVALMGETAATQFASTESAGVAECHWLLADAVPGGSAIQANGDLQRVLVHRRRALQRNIQSTRVLQNLLSPHQAMTMTLAPQRVSMFGRSSIVDFSMGRGTTVRAAMPPPPPPPQNDCYIMGGGMTDDGPMHDADELYHLNSSRSARGYVAAGGTPTAPGGGGGGGGAAAAASKKMMLGPFQTKSAAPGTANPTGSRGNHRSQPPPRKDWS